MAEDKKAAIGMMRKTGQMGVPVVILGDEVVVGFDQGMLDKLLAD